jgi:hypothetical protein
LFVHKIALGLLINDDGSRAGAVIALKIYKSFPPLTRKAWVIGRVILPEPEPDYGGDGSKEGKKKPGHVPRFFCMRIK